MTNRLARFRKGQRCILTGAGSKLEGKIVRIGNEVFPDKLPTQMQAYYARAEDCSIYSAWWAKNFIPVEEIDKEYESLLI